jgi:hypothetical protein
VGPTALASHGGRYGGRSRGASTAPDPDLNGPPHALLSELRRHPDADVRVEAYACDLTT